MPPFTQGIIYTLPLSKSMNEKTEIVGEISIFFRLKYGELIVNLLGNFMRRSQFCLKMLLSVGLQFLQKVVSKNNNTSV